MRPKLNSSFVLAAVLLTAFSLHAEDSGREGAAKSGSDAPTEKAQAPKLEDGPSCPSPLQVGQDVATLNIKTALPTGILGGQQDRSNCLGQWCNDECCVCVCAWYGPWNDREWICSLTECCGPNGSLPGCEPCNGYCSGGGGGGPGEDCGGPQELCDFPQ